jgi:hypothetical protein
LKNLIHYDGSKLGVLMYHFNIRTTPGSNNYHLSKMFGDISLIDRTETLDSAIKVKTTYPIPTTLKSVGDIDDIGMARAVELIDKANAENKTLRVMWSGGIDSTAALCWIMNCGKPINRFEIAYNQYSIDEYPAFYNGVLKNSSIPQVESTRYVLDIPDDIMLVTGEHGDQLFGSTLMKRFNNSSVKPYGYHEYDYEHNIHSMQLPMYPLTQMLFVEASDDNVNGRQRVYEYLKPLIDKAPFKLKTLYDLTWWLNFTLKWQEVAYRMTTSCPDKHNNHFGFFSSEEFQLWAMDEKNHMENKIDWSCSDPWNQSYKKALKEVIYKYTDDHYYRNNKPKVDSLMHHNLNGMCFRYDDGTYDTFKTIITNGVDFKNKYFNI